MSDRPSKLDNLPSDFAPIVFEGFDGLNTQSLRPAIKDTECAWLDGFMPYAPSTLKILWGIGPTVFTAAGATVKWMGFGNIGDTPYGVVLQSDGAVHVFNTDSGSRLQVMGAGAISNPSSIFGFSQWGSEQLIFAKDQTNGYWLWDGSTLFTAGALGPEIDIINGGNNYTSPPALTIRTTGLGTGTSFLATVQNQSVAKVTVTNPGSLFGKDDLVVIDAAGGGSDDQAIPLAPAVSVNAGGLDTIFVNNGGSGYTYRSTVVISGGGGSGASISLSIQNGTIIGAAVVETGTGYTTAPTLVVSDPGIPGSPAIPGGTGASLFCSVAFGQVTGIGMSYGGSNYTEPPTVRIVGDGTGATAFAVLSAGQVVGVQMTAMGKGYTVAIASFEGGNNAANVRPRLMPFGISGTTAEVYQQRVWVSNGSAVAIFPPKNRTVFSSSDSAVDFGDGGGAFQSRDSFLRVGYHWLKQSNGFLYLGGDSSINYVSGVTTSTPSSSSVPAQPVTTFGNQNVDPQLGSPWPSSVQVFSRNIVLANTLGIFASYGGAVQKVSEPLDGFYTSLAGTISAPTANFPSAVANIFGQSVYMLLLPVIDQRTGAAVNKLLMWNGKRFFTSDQDVPLTFIATQEINSVMTAWGTDGTHIFRLFQQPSTAFAKSAISKLFSGAAYWTTKTATRLSGVASGDGTIQPWNFTIDNEISTGTGDAAVSVELQHGGIVWDISWDISWGDKGLDVFGPYPVGQNGRMLGVSALTNMGDGTLLSVNVASQVFEVNL